MIWGKSEKNDLKKSLFILALCLFSTLGTQASVDARAKDAFSLGAAVRAMPEYNGIRTPYKSVKTYRQLIGAMTPDAQRWLTGSGLFLEDGRLDLFERLIMKKLAHKKYAMWYLTSPRLLDGIGLGDLAYVYLWNFHESPLKLMAKQLESMTSDDNGGVPPDAPVKFRRLVRRAEADPELALGLSLIYNLGKPRSDVIRYETAPYNTQLAMLGYLLDADRPSYEDRAMVAAAIAYGSVYTVADDELRSYLPRYAGAMVERMSSVIAARDGDLRDYGVVALMYLVWGAGGTKYPAFGDRSGPEYGGWYPAVSEKPMTVAEFNWMFPEAAWFDEVDDTAVLRKAKASLKADGSSQALLELHRQLGYVDSERNSQVVRYKGRRFRSSHVMNPKYYFDKYNQGLRVLGDSLDRSQLEVAAAKALGIPAISARLVINQGQFEYTLTLVYDPKLRQFVAYHDDLDMRRRNTLVETVQIGFAKLPWDNFRFDSLHTGSMSKIFDLNTDEVRALGFGIPPGYLIRGRYPDIMYADEFGIKGRYSTR